MSEEIIVRENFSFKEGNVFSPLSFCFLENQEKTPWERYLSHMSPNELTEFQKQKTEAAKSSFCFGKMTGKYAASTFLNRPLDTIEIDHGVFGYPVLKPDPKGYCISIAHTETAGLAVCFPETCMMGVDLEKIDLRNLPVIESVLGDTEKGLGLNLQIQKLELFHILWSVREALSKAIRTGFLIPMELLEIQAINNLGNNLQLSFKHFKPFEAKVFLKSEHVFAFVYPTRVTVDFSFMHNF